MWINGQDVGLKIKRSGDRFEQRHVKAVIAMNCKIVREPGAVPSDQLILNGKGSQGCGYKFHRSNLSTELLGYWIFKLCINIKTKLLQI